MNTTDRSVEAFDVALRRRFDFIEKMPNPSLIASLATHPVAAGVDLEKLLIAINRRIEILLDSAYCLGHSYFLNIATLADFSFFLAVSQAFSADKHICLKIPSSTLYSTFPSVTIGLMPSKKSS